MVVVWAWAGRESWYQLPKTARWPKRVTRGGRAIECVRLLASLTLAAALLVIVGAATNDYDAIAFGVLFAGFVAAACALRRRRKIEHEIIKRINAPEDQQRALWAMRSEKEGATCVFLYSFLFNLMINTVVVRVTDVYLAPVGSHE